MLSYGSESRELSHIVSILSVGKIKAIVQTEIEGVVEGGSTKSHH